MNSRESRDWGILRSSWNNRGWLRDRSQRRIKELHHYSF